MSPCDIIMHRWVSVCIVCGVGCIVCVVVCVCDESVSVCERACGGVVWCGVYLRLSLLLMNVVVHDNLHCSDRKQFQLEIFKTLFLSTHNNFFQLLREILHKQR